jgi:hypothetical protein
MKPHNPGAGPEIPSTSARVTLPNVIAPTPKSDFNPAEDFLLELPFRTEGTGWAARAAVIGRYLVYIGAPVLSYWFLIVDYFEFRRPKYTGGPWLDLLLGTGGLCGFHPEHDRYGGLPLPWIYPPLQTWLYLLGLAMRL